MNHAQPVRGCAMSQLGKVHAGLGIGFIGKHICSQAHFPGCQRGFLQDRKDSGVRCCQVIKSKTDNVF